MSLTDTSCTQVERHANLIIPLTAYPTEPVTFEHPQPPLCSNTHTHTHTHTDTHTHTLSLFARMPTPSTHLVLALKVKPYLYAPLTVKPQSMSHPRP
jgi:hypothetical protein